MATTATNAFQPPSFILSPHQQDLLFAALNSNRNTAATQQNNDGQTISPTTFDNTFDATAPPQAPGSGSLTNLDDSPFIDYDYDFDHDASYGDYDFTNLPQGQMIGNLPGTTAGTSSDGDAPANDKRGLSEDEENEDEPDGKRREGDDKVSKKPGRKPLTSEPTSKRKAQNRAAQRAFRERKEKHLKDLETKVQDLEKASEAANHENLILRAKVDKMTAELKVYKASASKQSSRSPPSMPAHTYHPVNNPNDVDFSFEFPKFGQLPGPPVLTKPLSRATTSPGEVPSRSTSFTSNVSPLDNSSHNSLGFGSNQNPANAGQSNGSNYSPLYAANLQNMNGDAYDYMRPNKSSSAGSTADSAGTGHNSTGHNTNHSSPASSNSHHGTSSSCGTSPEPCMHSPSASKCDAVQPLSTIGEESQPEVNMNTRSNFCSKLSRVCGSASQPVPHTMASPCSGHSHATSPCAAHIAAHVSSQNSAQNSAHNSAAQTPAFDLTSLDWLAAQNGNQFEPQLFGDYREPHDNILTGLYDDSFFNEAFALPQDFSASPFTLDAGQGQTPQQQHQTPAGAQAHHQAAPRHDLIGDIDAQLGDEEVVPAEKEMLTCTNMWEQIQSCTAVQNGEIDMDSLCSELQKKAKCSGEGPVIQETDFKDVLENMFSPGGFKPCPLSKGV